MSGSSSEKVGFRRLSSEDRIQWVLRIAVGYGPPPGRVSWEEVLERAGNFGVPLALLLVNRHIAQHWPSAAAIRQPIRFVTAEEH